MKRKFVQLVATSAGEGEYNHWSALDSEGHIWEWSRGQGRWVTADVPLNRMPWGAEPQESVQLSGWKEESMYGIALSTGKEQLMHAMADAICNEIDTRVEIKGAANREDWQEVILKYARRYNAHVGDSDKKLAQCFEEMAQLRRRAHKERLDGMKCIYDIFVSSFKGLDGPVIKECRDGMEITMDLNRPRSEDVDDKSGDIV